MSAVKRGYINSVPMSSFFMDAKHGKRGVIVTEKHWSHFPGQKTSLTYLSEVRNRRDNSAAQLRENLSQTGHRQQQAPLHHHKGHKRILSRIRKIAKNIMKKIRMKARSKQSGNMTPF